MNAHDIDRYRDILLSNPSAFVEGVHGFCNYHNTQGFEKIARSYPKSNSSDTWSVVKPILLALAAGYAGLKLGSGWGRYAATTFNPNGPVKGPVMKLLEAFLPRDAEVYWPGQPGYEAAREINFQKYLDNKRDRYGV